MTAIKKPGLRPKAQKQDDSIMGTNNSSIVSKRSVERLYYPHEPHFFRYFVKKPQRRAPLINRGYWLRMKAVDHVLQRFLEEPSSRTKIVMNLGAGYDPLPWQCFTRYPEACRNVKFIDVDYKDLMIRKRATVLATTELCSMFTNISSTETEILFKSDQYIQVGCDLRETSKLAKILSSVIDFENCLILFTAEVSVTYMTLEGADALLKWTATLPNARFCLLEQLLPQGIDHPFAKTMMAHFNKLQTPLQSVQRYPTTKHQEERFQVAGWSKVKARNLWELWGSSDFLSADERAALDKVEPFDEWEEFALFGCHYSLLVADNGECCKTVSVDGLESSPSDSTIQAHDQSIAVHVENSTLAAASLYTEYPKFYNHRRFAAAMPLRSNDKHEDLVGNFGGLGQSRLNSVEIYGSQTQTIPFHSANDGNIPSSRMCHTITDLGDAGALLVGGRNSPSDALDDCWIHHKWNGSWERVEDLPQPLFRHAAIHIGDGRVLVIGGKTGATTIFNGSYVWSRRDGWSQWALAGSAPRAFGASVILTSIKPLRGVLSGGIGYDGLVCEQSWLWEMKTDDGGMSLLYFTQKEADKTSVKKPSSLARFGATVVVADGRSFIIGGVLGDRLLPRDQEVVSVATTNSPDTLEENCCLLDKALPQPLFIGSSAIVVGEQLILMGGGAVCFSFGTFWTQGVYTIATSHKSSGLARPWLYKDTAISENAEVPAALMADNVAAQSSSLIETVTIHRSSLDCGSDFDKVLKAGIPLVLEQQDIGPCKTLWTNEYLKDKIGADREVVVHQSSASQMDFLKKNFEYVKTPFGTFIDALDSGEPMYLRSLSDEKPSDEPANVVKDFPSIAQDFQLPTALATVSENAHSSVLRISGPVSMWLHYDVMANVLCQIRGSKKLLLFPPGDVIHFGFAPGASSSSVDAFALVANYSTGVIHPHEVTLNPGDILFIPPLWLHTAKPIEGTSISVNVFFRNLQKGYAAGRDVYGNRDLQAYEKGRQDVARIAKAFSGVPDSMRRFYLLRLADELRAAAGSDGPA